MDLQHAEQPFGSCANASWDFEVPIVFLEQHRYDAQDPSAAFLQRCGYLTFGDLVEQEPMKVISFIQAHTYINLCAHVAYIFDMEFDFIQELVSYEYIEHDEGVGMVSQAVEFTFRLYHHVERLLRRADEPHYPLEEKSEVFMQAVQSSAGHLQWFLEVLHGVAAGNVSGWSPHHRECAYLIYLSGLILGEHLDGLYAALLIKHPNRTAPCEWPDASYMFFSKLVENGYCPREIQAFASMRCPATLVSSLLRLKNVRMRQCHKDCSLDFCPYETVDESTYKTEHVQICRGCQKFSIDSKQLLECYEAGEIPAMSFEFQTAEDCSLQVIKTIHSVDVHSSDPKSSRFRYVAISHVWSDGLGNPQHNALWTCQLMKIQAWVDALSTEGETPVPFWLDTLCVPHETGYRRKAINDMHRIYEFAFKTLVIDSSLWSIPASFSDSNPEVLLIKILACPWARRLWTFQEAYCAARSIFFQFREKALPIQEILQSLAATYCTPRSSEAYLTMDKITTEGLFRLDVILVCGIRFCAAFSGNTRDEWPIHRRFSSVVRALHARRTSHVGDEALCLATLLGRHPDFLHDIPDHLRLNQLIRSLKSLPQAIVFFKGPRYDVDGDRWIPKTFLTWTDKAEQLDAYTDLACTIDAEGIVANLAGLRFELTKDFPRANYGNSEVIPIAVSGSKDQYWIEFHKPGLEWDTFTNARLALLFHHSLLFPNTHGYNGRVVLVSIRREVTERIFARFETPVHVHLQVQVDALPNIPGIHTILLPNTQQWCIG
ncbi:hypothetical protein LTR10_015076 [Elasticomyces elasticus]|nr:hypothetical protein LTR10_015076 [Elasticomyces elasticus]KAK5034727.1 hypothetical protein LTR13_006383 [Exophiala sideris]